jgi:hypothetical protein
MVIELLSYSNSLLNPVLKWATLLLFAFAAFQYYRARHAHGGVLRQIATLLILGGAAGALAALFRIGGDTFVQWKWGESAFFLVLGIISLVIAYLVNMKLKAVVAILGSEEAMQE